MKKLLIFCLVIFLTASNSTFASAAARVDLSAPIQGIDISERANFISHPQALYGINDSSTGEIWTLCKSLDDLACTAARTISVQNHLPPCLTTFTINCIQSVYAVDTSGVKIEGEFLKYATPDYEYDYPASAVNNLPQGKGQGGIWKIPGVNHSGGVDSYFVSTNVLGNLEKLADTRVASQRFGFNKFDTGIVPVIEVTGPFKQAIPLDSSHIDKFGKVTRATAVDRPLAESYACAMLSTGICYSEKEFPSNYRFGMTVNLGNKLAGWFHGRIYDPIINVSENGKGQIITFEAFPVLVPSIYETVPTANLPQEFRNYLLSERQFSVGSGRFIPGISNCRLSPQRTGPCGSV